MSKARALGAAGNTPDPVWNNPFKLNYTQTNLES